MRPAMSPKRQEAGSQRDVGTVQAAAHWRFCSDHVLDGALEAGEGRVADLSGNGNHLEWVQVLGGRDVHQEAGTSPCLTWVHDQEHGEVLNMLNDESAAARGYFRTLASAPINQHTFEDGYTIEAIVKLPVPYDEEQHSWMGVLTRQGAGAELGRQGERELLATLSVSNCMEYQWVHHPYAAMSSATSWSRYLKDEEWHHVVIVNDTNETLLYVNGICDFACLQQDLKGIAAVPGKGWNIGASEWKGELDKLFTGRLSEIRITDRALSSTQWLTSMKPLRRLEGTNEGEVTRRSSDQYYFAFIPDPQKLVYLNPHMFNAQIEWVKQKHEELNIAMTALLGDVVDHSDAKDEWERASLAIAKLDQANIPYVMTAGNHDYDEADTYLGYFGPARFIDKAYVQGHSPSCYSSYSIMEAGSYTYLWLMADMKHLHTDLAWLRDVLNQHRALPTILISHDILYKREQPSSKSLVQSELGAVIWEELIAPYKQVFMTVNGHYDGSGYQVRANPDGHDVIQLLINYQDSYRGGNGWLRLAEMDEEHQCIRFCTYSPWVERLALTEELEYPDYRFLIGEDHRFTIPMNFKERFNLL